MVYRVSGWHEPFPGAAVFGHTGGVLAPGPGPRTPITIPAPSELSRRSTGAARRCRRRDLGWPPSHADLLSAPPHPGDSSRPERTTRFDERGIALSPDGQWYLYTSNETNRSEVYLSRLGGDGARWPVSNSGGAEPRWSRNGEVFFRTADSVSVTRITLGPVPKIEPPRALFADRSYYVGLESVWDVSPDGKQFVFVKTDDGNPTLTLMLDWIPGWRGR